MLSLVRAIRSSRTVPLRNLLRVVTSTLSGRSARNPPSASACDSFSVSISAPRPATPSTTIRSPVPLHITMADLSLSSAPLGPSESFLVIDQPLALVNRVSVTAGPSDLAKPGGSSSVLVRPCITRSSLYAATSSNRRGGLALLLFGLG